MENGDALEAKLEAKLEDPSSSSDSDDGIEHDSTHVVGGEEGEKIETTADAEASKAEAVVPVALSEDALQEIEAQQRRV